MAPTTGDSTPENARSGPPRPWDYTVSQIKAISEEVKRRKAIRQERRQIEDTLVAQENDLRWQQAGVPTGRTRPARPLADQGVLAKPKDPRTPPYTLAEIQSMTMQQYAAARQEILEYYKPIMQQELEALRPPTPIRPWEEIAEDPDALDPDEAALICIWCGEVRKDADDLMDHEEECRP